VTMRILILGGTWYLGRAIAEHALANGWQVTCFNRGRSGKDVPGTRVVHGDRTDLDSLVALIAHGPWDVVVDTSAYHPSAVVSAVDRLRLVTGQYVLISTVSAYRDWPHEPVSESSPLWGEEPDPHQPATGEQSSPASPTYGALKAGCERVVRQGFGEDAVILRPGVIVGPGDYLDRLPALLRRAARGGRMLVADQSDQPIQLVDVRDVAAFVLRLAADGVTGTFNVAARVGHATYGALLRECVAATGSRTDLVWADPTWLDRQGVRQWTQLPLWSTARGTWAVDTRRALDAGLICRPLPDTMADTWRWLQPGTEPAVGPQGKRNGLEEAREDELVAAWLSHGSTRR
jgi:2'-hydroxyisoflavone reductase